MMDENWVTIAHQIRTSFLAAYLVALMGTLSSLHAVFAFFFPLPHLLSQAVCCGGAISCLRA